jgi:hypothetical protein
MIRSAGLCLYFKKNGFHVRKRTKAVFAPATGPKANSAFTLIPSKLLSHTAFHTTYLALSSKIFFHTLSISRCLSHTVYLALSFTLPSCCRLPCLSPRLFQRLSYGRLVYVKRSLNAFFDILRFAAQQPAALLSKRHRQFELPQL